MKEDDEPKTRPEYMLTMMDAGIRHSGVELDVCREIISLLHREPDYFRRVKWGFRDG